MKELKCEKCNQVRPFKEFFNYRFNIVKFCRGCAYKEIVKRRKSYKVIHLIREKEKLNETNKMFRL